MAEHRACHGCLDGCTRESAVHCISCVCQPWPCDAVKAQELAASLSEDWHRMQKQCQRLTAEHERLRPALAQIVGAFTSGIYCSNCGESLDDGCLSDCVIGTGRRALQ